MCSLSACKLAAATRHAVRVFCSRARPQAHLRGKTSRPPCSVYYYGNNMSRDIPAAILRLSPYTTVTRVAILPRGSRWRWKVHGSYLGARPGVAPADHDSVERESEFRHEDPARTQASESSTHTDTTCACTDCDHVVLETGGPEPIPRLQQLSRICLHKGTPLSPIVIWIVWRCVCR